MSNNEIHEYEWSVVEACLQMVRVPQLGGVPAGAIIATWHLILKNKELTLGLFIPRNGLSELQG